MTNQKHDKDRLDRLVQTAQRDRQERDRGYRAKALKMYPLVCGRCQREFDNSSVHELTVHHRNHDHDCNPEDGSNWELLCLYCHDNEHQRQEEALRSGGRTIDKHKSPNVTHNPFAGLKDLLKE